MTSGFRKWILPNSVVSKKEEIFGRDFLVEDDTPGKLTKGKIREIKASAVNGTFREMGNNTSSIPRRRSSVAREATARSHSSTNHSEFAGSTSPIKIKGQGNLNNSPALRSNLAQDRGPASTSPSYSQQREHLDHIPSDPPNYDDLALNDHHSDNVRVHTPNILIDNLVDHDYFGTTTNSGNESRKDEIKSELNNEVTNVLNGTTLYDDEYGYGIDDDLISTATAGTGSNNEFTKKVLIKYHKHAKDNDNNLQKKTDLVYAVGSFNHWSKKVQLEPEIQDGEVLFFKTLMTLPYGVYRLKFIVNNEIRYSDNIPIATDKFGNVVNWFEVEGFPDEIYEAGYNETRILNNKLRSSLSFLQEGRTQHNEFSTNIHGNVTPVRQQTPSINLQDPIKAEKLDYSQNIPSIFQSISINSEDDLLPVDEDFLHKNPIPELPVYLNNSYLNKHFNTHHHNNSGDKINHQNTQVKGLNSHIMPHVNLNHLLTSNVKNGTVGVACTTRYVGKFVTKIMYSPSDYDL